MRSRYAAYSLGLVEYILQTTAEEARQARGDLESWRREIQVFCDRTLFVGLEVLAASETGANGSVTFIARLQQDGADASFREASEFIQREGHWFYLAGKTENL